MVAVVLQFSASLLADVVGAVSAGREGYFVSDVERVGEVATTVQIERKIFDSPCFGCTSANEE